MTRPGAPASAPTASSTRFALLIAAVLVTSAFIFLTLYFYLPKQHLAETIETCKATFEADPAVASPLVTSEDVRRFAEASRRGQACLSPALMDETVFAAGGFGVLFVLAGLLYLAHPWWIVRRRRLRSLPSNGASPLRDELEQLSREMGLARSPDWRLAPFARTAGGQAFGLPWHRYVQIDAGLAILRVTDRPGFRAVVLHELAHLRNRDVDKTYLTVSIWRAFALVVLLPFLIITLHPGLFAAPLDWRWQNISFVTDPASAAYRVGSLLVLVGLVYLTRNAILRVRETHADATAAAHDGPNSALPTVLRRLQAAPWWRRWGTHPQPSQRIATVRDPRLLLTAGFWELAGAGFATGLVCSNISLIVSTYFTLDPVLALAVAGAVACSPGTVLLAVAIWRTVARDPSATPPARVWLGYPAALVGGYAAGTFPTLKRAASLNGGGSSVSAASWLLSTLLLLTGAVFLAAWLASVTRGVLARPDRPLWTMPAVVAVAAFFGAVTFAVWWPFSLIDTGFDNDWGDPPAAGAEIGWYTNVAAVTGADFRPMARFVYNPLTLLGLTLMWLVPILAGMRRRVGNATDPLRPALIAGFLGALAVAAGTAALPFAAKAALPVEVRSRSDAEGLQFLHIYGNTTLAIASVAVAAVMAAVLARRGPQRPALALMAGCLTTVLSAFVLAYLTDPLACQVNVWEAVPPPANCFDGLSAAEISLKAHWTILQALLVAVPATLAAAAAGYAYRRARPLDATSPADLPPQRFAAISTGIAVALLAAASIWFSVLTAADAYVYWLEQTFG